ncbi:MAG: TIGR01212 family radical SAM protein [Candidatus Omnitrophota bacterium]|nr:TIGR01212 family radical SAM protein [Candidatus Omnitrophota bacterium]
MKERYCSFNRYLQDKFGVRVHRISVNAGFGCPNFDGTKSREGCIFCNNKAFSHYTNLKGVSLEEQITQGMKYARNRFKAKKFILYFQSFSNTYADISTLREKYSYIKKFDDIVGLAISTRPDCIDKEKLDMIEGFCSDYEVYLEYGLGSVGDKTLELINRNHLFIDFVKAVELTTKYNINIGVHLILGLPGEKIDDMFETARILSKMPLWGVKFHCLHVVKDTGLEKLYNNREIELLSQDEYVNILVRALEIIPDNWVILRLVSDADRSQLIAPLWINNKQEVLRKIEAELVKRNSCQGLLNR